MKFLGPPSSGSIAGTTSSHNRAGQYTRNRRAPVQPIGTGRRAFIRASFGLSSGAWSSLTSAQQAAWTSFAASYPITDALGQSITLTGHQMFVRCSTSLINVGQAVPTTPPATNAVPDVSSVTFAFSIATGISFDGFTGTPGDFVALAVSAPMSPGRSFNKTFWQPLGEPGYTDASSAPGLMPTATYAAQFGTPVIGQAVFCKVTPVNVGGFNGTPAIVRTLVVA